MSTPAVSVIVTCYDLGQFLHEAVDSVLAQTFQDFEILIVNDGSTDRDTLAVLASFQRPRTRVIHIENRGLPGARNEGIKRSSGRLLCTLDADDRLEATWLEKAVAHLEANPQNAFVSHWLRTFGDESADWTPDRCDLEMLVAFNTVNGAAVVRREAFLEVGGYDESMVDGCEDWDLWLTMVERGHTGAIIPEVLFFYRRRQNSMSRAMFEGDRFHTILDRLIRKHEQSYRQHIGGLVARRERELAVARRDLYDRRLEDIRWLLPQVTRSRQQLAALRAKVQRTRYPLDQNFEVEALRKRIDEAYADRNRLAVEIDAERTRLTAVESDRARLLTVEAETGRLYREIADLHSSLTWRLTRPIRALVGWLRRLGGE